MTVTTVSKPEASPLGPLAALGGRLACGNARTRFLLLALTVFWSVALSSGQDLDLVLYAGDPEKRSVIDQIEDPEERDAFVELRETTDPARKRALAEAFLERFPKSWLVAFAHSMAAKACIALDDLQAGLEHGRRSIRILPENGTLLVALANVQVLEGLLEEAERNAADALAYLGRFRHPSLYTKSEWERVGRELRASAHFVLGRVAATRAFRAPAAETPAMLVPARESLRSSIRLNRRDGIALLLLGIVEEALGNSGEALSAFEAAARVPGPVQASAMAKLQEAFRDGGEIRSSLKEFRAGIRPLRVRAQAGTGPDRPALDPPGSYAGSEGCRDCHEQVFDAWSNTGMAKMFRPYGFENVIGDFQRDVEFRDPAGDLLARMLIDGDRHYFELPTGQGTQRFPVDYTIGSKWQQAYATRLPNGQIHVVPIQYNVLHRKWVNFWEELDDGPSERSRLRDFHRMRLSTSYQVHCSPCHTSQVQAEGSLVAAERITYREAGINCEMCHGPSRAHETAMRAGNTEMPEATDPPLRFGELDHRSYVSVCAQCHMQSGIVETGPRGEINYSGRQESFLNQREQRPYEEYSRTAFYKDGRFRETTFIAESFMRTECFRRGQAHCGHCHDPHPADSATNPTSLKHRDEPNRMCLQCHESLAEDPEAHTRHADGSEASQCVSCHMPKIMNSMMFLAGTHRIDDIPDAGMTARFGREESPNACLACHENESIEWLESSLEAWQDRDAAR